jgi:hypothetical protein
VVEVLVDIAIEFLLDLPACFSHLFHNCVFHITPQSLPL